MLLSSLHSATEVCIRYAYTLRTEISTSIRENGLTI